MEYIYHAGDKEAPIFILLHGTGGDEQQMLSVGQYLDAKATLLSIRGTVSENGMNRYFKRLAEGVYDIEDLHQRGQELHQWIIDFAAKENLDLSQAIYVGFSNGSNIAINMLLQEDTPITKGILFAPMYPVPIAENLDLSSHQVFLSMGENDPICPPAESQNVIDIFEDRGSQVTTFWVNSHEISLPALNAAKEWVQTLN